MAIKPIMALPKGSPGMILFGTRNDDTTVTLPDIEFDLLYNGSLTRTIRTSGNSWIGIGASSEHIKINRRDASYNNLYYAKEIDNGYRLFRIRFEGNSTYNGWGSNNLVWEASFYETGVITLVMEETPNNGVDSFVNPGIGTQSFIFEAKKSYVFIPRDKEGKNYELVEGSYYPKKDRYLVVDAEGIKNFQTVDGKSKWVKIADLPITEDLLLTHGNDTFPTSIDGLISDSPTVYYYTDNINIVQVPEQFKFKLTLQGTSLPKVVMQKGDFLIAEGKSISHMIVDMATDNTNGKIRLVISVDGGTIWLTFNMNINDYEPIDTNDLEAFLSNGINPENLNVINYDKLNELINENRRIKFAYILSKPKLADVCKLKKLKIFYN